MLNVMYKNSKKHIYAAIALATSLLCSTQNLSAQDSKTSALLTKLEAMEAEIAALKAELSRQASPSKETASKSAKATAAAPLKTPAADLADESMFRPQPQTVASTSPTPKASSATSTASLADELSQFGITYRSDGFKMDGMRLGAYGEAIFGRSNANGEWNNGFDAHRMVLLGTYQLSNNIIFNTELEFEHGGIAKEEDDKLNGAIEVEQLFIDFRVNEHFTWRSPGVDVIPVGFINLFHEPTQFYSSERPELYHNLIPSTWYAASTGAYGKIIDGLNYQAQVSSSLEDAGTTASDGGKVPASGYEAGISGSEGLKMARAPIGDNQQVSDNVAYTLRLSYTPHFMPGLAGSSSVYYTDNTTPRGAYGGDSSSLGQTLGGSSLSLFDSELRYRIPKTGIELRSEFVQANIGNSGNLRANNDGDSSNNVGDSMRGYSFEAAYHYNLSSNPRESWEFVPFYRFSKIDLQTSGAAGTDPNDPSGAGNQEYHTFGTALFPTPKVVLKVDYQFMHDRDELTPTQKAVLGSVGFFF